MLPDCGPLVLIGAGRMGGAMLSRWVDAGLVPTSVTVIDPGLPDKGREALISRGVTVFSEPGAATGLSEPNLMVLAVKPQMMDQALSAYAALAVPSTIVVSVAAGVRMSALQSAFAIDQPIVRVMPNTPCLVGAGMSVGFANEFVGPAAKALVDALMRTTGAMAWIDDESLMDAVTAVSGSGPAYVFYLAEVLADAGRAAGLPNDLAEMLARQTVVGGGQLLAESEIHASVLRENVTSPAGTTAAALEILMAENGLETLMREAVESAKKRSVELGS